MMVPPIPWRCSAGIPASFRVRLAISPSTYDSVNFFEPMMTGCAFTERAARKRKTIGRATLRGAQLFDGSTEFESLASPASRATLQRPTENAKETFTSERALFEH